MFSSEQILEFKSIARYIIRNLKRFNVNLNDKHIAFLIKFSNTKTCLTDPQITYFMVIKDKIVTYHVEQQIKALQEFIDNIKLKKF